MLRGPLYPDSRFIEYNPNHEPAGSTKGGEFAARKGSANAASTTAAAGPRGGGLSPASPGRPTANTQVQDEASRYAVSIGLAPVKHGYVELNQTHAGEIADAFDRLPVSDMANPAVSRAYAALGREVQAQWDFAKAQGMTMEPWTKPGQPYQTSTEMAADVKNNRHLYFYTGGEPHPALGTKDAAGLAVNDKFRAIHDYFGHAAGGYGFGARGEENAWRAHSQMFTPEARRAMTTETRGQNSFVNFGRHNYNNDGSLKNIPAKDKPFAPQKVALLPDHFIFE